MKAGSSMELWMRHAVTAVSAFVLSFAKTGQFGRDPTVGAMSMILLFAGVDSGIAMWVLEVLRDFLLQAQGRVAANILPCNQSNFLPLEIDTTPCGERCTD
jgi:hypothetical protein